MFGLLLGAACLLGLTVTVACQRAGQCSGRRGHGFRGRHGRFFLNRLLERLDTTPGQEKVIREAVTTVAEDVRRARSDFKGSRGEVAHAVRGELLDRAALAGIFARHDQVIGRLREAALEAFSKVHDTLDQRQREILAELIESGPFGRGFWGPGCGHRS